MEEKHAIRVQNFHEKQTFQDLFRGDVIGGDWSRG
jgi:hypothetical protein